MQQRSTPFNGSNVIAVSFKLPPVQNLVRSMILNPLSLDRTRVLAGLLKLDWMKQGRNVFRNACQFTGCN